jgi:hypothetical protein
MDILTLIFVVLGIVAGFHAIESGKVTYQRFNIEKPDNIKIQEQEDKEEMEQETSPHELYGNIETKINAVKNENAENEVTIIQHKQKE